jgi:hypothetical protein
MKGFEGFTSRSLANCLAGLFRPKEKHVELSGRTITELQVKNLIERIGSLKDENFKTIGLYQITPDGVRAMVEAVSEHRIKMRQEIGAKFTILAQEQLSASSNLGPPMDDKVLDAEEKVLDEMYSRFIERNRIKNVASTKRKKIKPNLVLPLN